MAEQAVLSVMDSGGRIALILLVLGGAHLLVNLVARAGERLLSLRAQTPRRRKLRSVISLATSALVFALYFIAVGFVLRELGISLTAYLASASIIGLAVGFGSQGLVQDVVTGLTLVFTDLVDVGEMVEISGQTGLVRRIGMRFVELENAVGAQIYIPNRSIGNVINYPRGYLLCLIDVRLPAAQARQVAVETLLQQSLDNLATRFPAVLLQPAGEAERLRTPDGQTWLRGRLGIWPGRGDVIEKHLRPELLATLQQLDAGYADWMVAVHYETARQLRAG